MTNCTTQPLLFSSLGSKKIQADFNGGSLTSDAGALLLREADKRLGLIDALNRLETKTRPGESYDIVLLYNIEGWLKKISQGSSR
jgi:hypothetical protein